jgi:hypothetical protein
MNEEYKRYEDLKADDYFVGNITIIGLIESYKIQVKYTSRIVDVNRYKTKGYIPEFHSYKKLKIGRTYEIRGYMFEDGYLRSFGTKEVY